ncbi:MAG: hypothetical protein OXI03_09860 [Chloroflexota bacterium]|nr:hypothetical protein [Chloroflexota bacterium]
MMAQPGSGDRSARSPVEPVRLGCQTSVTGDVVIHKAGVYVDPFA